MTELSPFGMHIWIAQGDTVKMCGIIPFTTRMTVVRLASGGLWIHSPVNPVPDLIQAVRTLGRVDYLVAPNKIHSLGIMPWKEHFPSAQLWGSPQFNLRHPAIKLDDHLTDETPTPWEDEITHKVVGGHAFLDEVVFFHKASATLIVTDLIQKHDPGKQSWLWKVVKGMVGVLGKTGGVPLDVRLSFKDRKTARRSLETILRWDFDNLVISHGTCLQGGAKKEVERCFSWLLS